MLVSGCLSLPQDEQRENLIYPPSLEKSTADALNSGVFQLGSWPEEQWWTVFQIDELNALVAQALESEPSLQSTEKRVSAAQEEAKVVRSKLFPLLFFDATESWAYLSKNGLYRAFNPKIPISGNLVDLTLSLHYEFDFWGKNRNLFQAALGRSRAAEAEFASAKLVISTSVAGAYFSLRTNLCRQRLYRELYQLKREIFDLQKLLNEKALLSQLEPLLSEEECLEAEKLLIAVTEEIATNRHLINILIGKSPDDVLAIDENQMAALTSLSIPETLSVDLLARRPDLMAQIWQVEALAHEVGAAKADFFPDINLIALAGLESFGFRHLFRAQSKTGALNPAIHLPIFTAGEIRANLNKTKAEFDAAVFAYNELLLKSAGEVADILVLATSIFAQMSDQNSIVAAAKKRDGLTELRRTGGLDSIFQRYRSREEVILKELDQISLLYAQYLAAIKLMKALGGGYTAEKGVPLTK